jgi:hypothetical protein
VRRGRVKDRQIIKSGGKREKFSRPMTVALGGLINTNANVILLKLLAKYYTLKV